MSADIAGVALMLESLVWPGTAVVVGIAFLLIFKSSLTRLIDRIYKVGPTGFTATPTIQESGKRVEPPQGEQFKEFDNAILVKYEAKVREDLDGRRFASPADREKFLTRKYTAAVLCLAFERVYIPMYGSQLATLQFLNTCGTVGGEEAVIFANFFSPAKVLYPQIYTTYSFEQWVQYLTGHDLLSRNGTRLTITAEAKEFLKYLLEQGYTFNKPF